MRLTFSEIKSKIGKIVPSGIDYDVDIEAGSIAIITTQPESFGGAGGENLTVKTVSYTHLTLPTKRIV